MDRIIENWNDPSWWFTGIFFTFVAVFIAWLLKKFPNLLKSLLIKWNSKRQKKIKNDRWNDSMIQYQISKSQSRFVLFIFVSLSYLIWFFVGSLNKVFELSFLWGIVFCFPIYIAEIFWLVKDEYVKDLIKSRNKIRITSQ